jgi:hypothetical protein
LRAGGTFPGDQAEIVFNDVFVEYLEALPEAQRRSVLVEVTSLCANPSGDHPLSNRTATDHLAGWNTLDVLNKEHRVVFSSRVIGGVGTIEVLCAGPRRAEAAYDLANALVRTGRLEPEEVTEIWQVLTLLDVLAEEAGLDGWDYAPPAAPQGMVRAAVAAGLLDEATARLLSKDELEAAMSHGWGPGGADPVAALRAAMSRARAGVDPGDVVGQVLRRREGRCAVVLPRTHQACIRKAGHPGAHRSTA